MSNLVGSYLRHDSGATSIEYALIAGCIAMAVVTTLTTMGGEIFSLYTSIANAFP
jgi:pilus assembly protein Flp/PilA